MDAVNHPNHYQLAGLDVEAMDVIRSVVGSYGFRAFCRGNELKYLIRANKKNGVEDLRKADYYLRCEIAEWEALGDGE